MVSHMLGYVVQMVWLHMLENNDLHMDNYS